VHVQVGLEHKVFAGSWHGAVAADHLLLPMGRGPCGSECSGGESGRPADRHALFPERGYPTPAASAQIFVSFAGIRTKCAYRILRDIPESIGNN